MLNLELGYHMVLLLHFDIHLTRRVALQQREAAKLLKSFWPSFLRHCRYVTAPDSTEARTAQPRLLGQLLLLIGIERRVSW